MTTKISHHHILIALVVQVAEGGPTSRHRSSYARIGALESAVVIHCKQRKFLVMQGRVDAFNVIQYMTLRYKQIFPTVIVEVFQTNSPTRTSTGKSAQSS